MAAIMFDGKAFAAGWLQRTADEAAVLSRPVKLAAVYNSTNAAAKHYTRIKARTANDLGIMFEAHDLTDIRQAEETIRVLNRDPDTTGLMLQLPFAGGGADEWLCRMIAPEKDADGLNPKSGVKPATVRAVAAIVQEGLEKTRKTGRWPLLMTVVGSRGNVGRGVVKEYENDIRFEIRELDRGAVRADRLNQAEVIVSAAGQPGLIRREMVRPGAVVVDVGYPEGDVAEDVAEAAGFLTPVPGGVGPVTVAMLFRNLMDLL